MPREDEPGPDWDDSDVEARLDTLEQQMVLLIRSSWVGEPVYRGLPPRVPRRDALPTAADNPDRIVVLEGSPAESGGTADKAYISLRDHEGTWEWCELASGTAES